jgi:hypothetical protein
MRITPGRSLSPPSPQRASGLGVRDMPETSGHGYCISSTGARHQPPCLMDLAGSTRASHSPSNGGGYRTSPSMPSRAPGVNSTAMNAGPENGDLSRSVSFAEKPNRG